MPVDESISGYYDSNINNLQPKWSDQPSDTNLYFFTYNLPYIGIREYMIRTYESFIFS